jgi:hypothetical protein
MLSFIISVAMRAIQHEVFFLQFVLFSTNQYNTFSTMSLKTGCGMLYQSHSTTAPKNARLARQSLHRTILFAAAICLAPVHGWMAVPVSAAPTAKPGPATSQKPAWVQGQIRGIKFSIEKAFYGKNNLLLRSGFTPALIEYRGAKDPNAFTGVELFFPSGVDLEGRTFVATEADAEAKRLPLAFYAVSTEQTLGSDPYFQKLSNIEPYSMTLKFFGRQKGLLPGYIELHSGRERHTTDIKGYFYAQPQKLTPAKSRTR